MKRLLLPLLSLFLVLAATAQTARVQIIHNSPDTLVSTVDIWLNDNSSPLFNDVNFREATPFFDAPAGTAFDITIQPSNSTDTTNGLFRQTFTLPANDTFIVIANGIVSSTGYSPSPAFGLDIFPTARETSANMMTTDVLVYHGSPDAPIVDAYESSVPAGTVVDDIAYQGFQGYLSLATADYELQVRNQNNSAIVAAYKAPLSTLSLGGQAITVLASGFLDPSQNSNGPAFGLYAATAAGGALVALPVDTIPTARVQAIHNSADAAAATVDVWLNDGLLADNFSFRTATPFVDAQAGVPFDISIAAPNSTDTTGAIARYTYTLMEDSTYILVANGIVSGSGYSPATPFDIDVFASAREASANSNTTDVLVYHGATDAPAVDVDEISIPAGNLISNLSYSNYDGYLSLPTNDYVLEVSVNGTSTVVETYNAPLSTLGLGGEAITVLASGFVNPTNNSNGPAFGLWVAQAAGGNLVPLPVVTSLDENALNLNNEVNVYPVPATDILNVEIDNATFESMEILDLNGRVVAQPTLSNTFNQTIDISGLESGTYLLKMTSEEAFAIKRIIVE